MPFIKSTRRHLKSLFLSTALPSVVGSGTRKSRSVIGKQRNNAQPDGTRLACRTPKIIPNSQGTNTTRMVESVRNG
ncbi:uncharacterized protein EV420DRAFT_1566573 [Desarmillaria tabescens]|uniref:Secreted protein n=1 Tax=Armillaria tabescens TaxID=1929756 RepID=A0AA39JV10_ARMTA|nr:uncharacterized protein EV420DRAFT_1566573 [Desarmillaria tabescens]KAK0448395.1 hypothetical protein EV420DRAFT_1566573 [Desarmillaria tabescens]